MSLRNEQGKFELILSDAQLLGGIGILAVLCGFFFGIGYLARDHDIAAAASSPKPASVARVAEADVRTAPAPVNGGGSMALQPGQYAVCEAVSAPAATQPPAEAPKPEARPAHAPQPPAPPATAGHATASDATQPVPGKTYLQIAAGDARGTSRLAQNLREKGLPVILAPGPTPDLQRVLVGPSNETMSLDQLRARVRAAGYRPIVRRY